MKLPVFFHIPKCYGTFIHHVIILRNLNKKNKNLVHINLLEKNKEVSSVIGIPNFKTEKKIERLYLEFNNNLLSEIEPLALIINSEGFYNHEKYIDIFKKETEKFTFIRKSLQYHLSFFYYLRDFGKWEDDFGCFSGMNFNDYINSDKITDSWLIRQITQIPKDQKITEEIYEKAKNIMSSFSFIGFEEKIDIFFKQLKKRYDWDYFEADDKSKNKNIISKKENIFQCDIDKFNKITHYENKLYNYLFERYCQMPKTMI